MLTTSTDFDTKIAIELRILWNLPPTTPQKNPQPKAFGLPWPWPAPKVSQPLSRPLPQRAGPGGCGRSSWLGRVWAVWTIFFPKKQEEKQWGIAINMRKKQQGTNWTNPLKTDWAEKHVTRSPVTCDPDWPWRPSGDQPETRVVNDGTHLRKNKQ